ncbi:odorant receptor 131-2-like [Engraulis encrasicolus]|uniref:odorant receptor 131-2-like n=1 Tax=Engraulis encrasicolus TaxID=184585 RepID=UPI002FD7679B
MNTTIVLDNFRDALSKNLTVVLCGLFILYVNSSLLRVYFTVPSFAHEARYVLYIFLVFNDMVMVTLSVLLHVLSYQPRFISVALCYILVFLSGTTYRNTPLILAGMAMERFVAVCLPLHHGRLCTASRARRFNLIVWWASSIPSLANIILSLWERHASFYTSVILCYHVSLYPTAGQKVITAAGSGIYMAFVWVTLVYTYTHVLCTARAASSNRGQIQKAQNTILLHAAQLLLCMLSFVTPVIENIVLSMLPNLRNTVPFANFLTTNLLPRILSPLIYGVRDKAFRKHMKGALLCQGRTQSTMIFNKRM